MLIELGWESEGGIKTKIVRINEMLLVVCTSMYMYIAFT